MFAECRKSQGENIHLGLQLIQKIVYNEFECEINVKNGNVHLSMLNIVGYYILNCIFQMESWFIFCSLCLVSDLRLTAAFIKGLVRHTETIANE